MKLGILPGLLLLFSSVLHAQWEEFPVLPGESLWASSVLSETLGGTVYEYPPENLFDGDKATPWVEGVSGDGAGESLTILANRAVTGFSLVNGFAKSASLYDKNNRIKSLELSLLAGFTAPGMISETDAELYLLKEIRLKDPLLVHDGMERQSFDIPLTEEEQFDLFKTVLIEFAADHPFFLKMMLQETGLSDNTLFTDDMSLRLLMEVYGFFALRVTIRDVYKGSRYDDTCISEISLELEEF
ncbi:MAG: hypothetical protein PQJ58_12435 [Spirochaetales bacterium]|nr:hypothetical protein [Spirochaetales bacterium]